MPEGRDAQPAHTLRLFLVVALLAAGFAVVPRVMRSCASPMAMEVAPDFTTKIVANAEAGAETTFTLSALRGHAVVLDFWATWCGPCQAQSPIVNTIAARFKSKGVVVVGVNTSDSPGLAAPFAARKKLTFPMLYDEGNEIARKFGVETLPTLIVVSKEGKVVAVRHGLTSDSELEGLVKRAL